MNVPLSEWISIFGGLAIALLFSYVTIRFYEEYRNNFLATVFLLFVFMLVDTLRSYIVLVPKEELKSVAFFCSGICNVTVFVIDFRIVVDSISSIFKSVFK